MTDIQGLLWEIQGRLTTLELKLLRIEEGHSKPKRSFDWRQKLDNLWIRAVVLGILLAGNVKLIDAVQVAFR